MAIKMPGITIMPNKMMILILFILLRVQVLMHIILLEKLAYIFTTVPFPVTQAIQDKFASGAGGQYL
jgi:hypothetical protein